jgi:hypothetical protein
MNVGIHNTRVKLGQILGNKALRHTPAYLIVYMDISAEEKLMKLKYFLRMILVSRKA